MSVLLEFVEKLKAENAEWVADFKDARGEVTIFVPRESIVDVCWVLKTKHQFDMLADLCGADRGPEEDPRFEVNYHLFSTIHHNRLRLKVLLVRRRAECRNSYNRLENRRLARARNLRFIRRDFRRSSRFEKNTFAVGF